MRKIILGCLALVLGLTLNARADLIDFETGFVDQQAVVAAVTTATNSVSFWVGNNQTAYIAQVGGVETAFVPFDRTANPAVSGQYFLTDEFNGPSAKLPYYMSFAVPVLNLSLNLYDYRRDGGPQLGDTATLTVFDAANNPVGAAIYTIPTPNPVDGNIALLAVLNPSAPIASAALTFSQGDVGTGIDNISFTTVPLPPAALLLGSGLVGLLATRRYRRS